MRRRRSRPMFRLPDIPNVGYATMRERSGSDSIMFHMRAVERDRLLLLTIVTEGIAKWHAKARAAFGYSLAIPDDTLNEMYWYFTLLACPPVVQRELIEARGNTLRTREVLRDAMPGIEAQLEAVKQLPRRSA